MPETLCDMAPIMALRQDEPIPELKACTNLVEYVYQFFEDLIERVLNNIYVA